MIRLINIKDVLFGCFSYMVLKLITKQNPLWHSDNPLQLRCEYFSPPSPKNALNTAKYFVCIALFLANFSAVKATPQHCSFCPKLPKNRPLRAGRSKGENQTVSLSEKLLCDFNQKYEEDFLGYSNSLFWPFLPTI